MEASRAFYIEKIDGSCLRLEAVANSSTRVAGAETTIRAVIVEVSEATPSTNFWGTLGACHNFELIVRRKN